MNRKTSEASKVLGVDASQVKRWAWVFKDYLSLGANPPKGKVRIFNDHDLLVLCYVGNEWEDKPDIENIKSGLNVENHYEPVFLEHLYLHTPLLQELPEELNETWRHGIVLGCGCRYEYLELARNYRDVAESTLRSALEKDELSARAYPVLFAYRHTLELYLKLIGEIDETTHSLARCMHLVEKRHKTKFKSPIREWILELEEIDPGGTAFRYAEDEQGSSPYMERWFDFLHFQFAMKRVFDVLDMAILRTGAKGKPAKKKK